LLPAEFLSFVYISVHLIRHHLVCQFAQVVTSFYPSEAFYSANTSLTVSLLMSKQLVRVGIKTNYEFLYENCRTSQFVYWIYTQDAKRDPTPH